MPSMRMTFNMSVWYLLRSMEMVKDIDVFVGCSICNMYDIWKYERYGG